MRFAGLVGVDSYSFRRQYVPQSGVFDSIMRFRLSLGAVLIDPLPHPENIFQNSSEFSIFCLL